MKLSIIVPVYNEEKTACKLLSKVLSIDYGVPFEIIVVNDGSTDNSKKEILKLKNNENLKIVSYFKNRGKGYAVRRGTEKSKSDIIIIQDADLEYDPQQIPNLIKPIVNGEYKVVYGSRFLGRYYKMKKLYLLANKFLTYTLRILFGSKITDMETCYKAFHVDVLNELNLRSDGFEIEAEITSKILKKGHKIKELPIKYIAREKEEGKKINWKDGFKILMVLLKVKTGLI